MSSKAILAHSDEAMKRTVEKMMSDYGSIRTSRANPALLEGIRVDYYGTLVPLRQIANIGVPEPRTLEIKPWDKGAMTEIEKAIAKSDLGLNPNNDGSIIRIVMPQMTEERRKDMIKAVRKMTEEYRVAIRNIRREAVEKLKAAQKNKELSEDELKGAENEAQKQTDSFIHRIDASLQAKEKEITEV